MTTLSRRLDAVIDGEVDTDANQWTAAVKLRAAIGDLGTWGRLLRQQVNIYRIAPLWAVVDAARVDRRGGRMAQHCLARYEAAAATFEGARVAAVDAGLLFTERNELGGDLLPGRRYSDVNCSATFTGVVPGSLRPGQLRPRHRGAVAPSRRGAGVVDDDPRHFRRVAVPGRPDTASRFGAREGPHPVAVAPSQPDSGPPT